MLMVEDHTLVRKGLCALLQDDPAIIVAGEAENGRDALEKAELIRPHVVVMDISMPGMNGLEATLQLKKRFPEINVLILSMYSNEEYIFQTLRAGATGYILKKSVPQDLVTAIRTVSKGKPFLSPEISQSVIGNYIGKAEKSSPHDDPYVQLTPREREVLQLLAEGMTNRIIAKHLHISVKTVETHRANLLEKLNIESTVALIKYAIRKGLIILEE